LIPITNQIELRHLHDFVMVADELPALRVFVDLTLHSASSRTPAGAKRSTT
jgi:hypothetical protein